MIHQDDAGIAVAAAAFLLAAAVLAFEGYDGANRLWDRAALARASGTALETGPVGQPVEWRDGATGTHGVVTPSGAYRDASGRWCRPYEVTLANGDDPPSRSRHVSCRDDHGGWSELATPTRSASAFERWLDTLIGPPEQVAERRG
ncbi:MAG: hypothetical protein ACM31L_10560 [Actinomycetota bacterium]